MQKEVKVNPSLVALFALNFLTVACGSTKLVRYQITSSNPASVELDGLQVCENTPCEVTTTAYREFVGTAGGGDGYECDGIHHISGFPENNLNLSPQTTVVYSCVDSDLNTLNFDFSKKSVLNASRGQYLKPSEKKIRYLSAGHQYNYYQNIKDDSQTARSTDMAIFYGQEFYRWPWTILTADVVLSKELIPEKNNFEIGATVNAHWSRISMFYVSGGLFYKKIENSFYDSGLFPYVGLGVLINHKSIKELFWNLINVFTLGKKEFTYKIGEFKYDLVIQNGFFLHTKNDWNARATNFALRIYF